LALIGEIGLSGELRWVRQMEPRLREAEKLGFKVAVIPKRLRANFETPKKLEIFEARSLKQAVKIAIRTK
jgi:DNA repair protein RadA/Sms